MEQETKKDSLSSNIKLQSTHSIYYDQVILQVEHHYEPTQYNITYIHMSQMASKLRYRIFTKT